MTLEELFQSASGGCQMPGCDHAHDNGPLVLASRCHPQAGTKFSINVAKKTMHVECATCEQPIITIECDDRLHPINTLPLQHNKETN
jgi:hypothetical protein